MTTLKSLRLERDLSQGALGALLGTDYMAVWRWETLRSDPRWRNVRKLERMFGLPIEELLAPVPDNERAAVPRRSDARRS